MQFFSIYTWSGGGGDYTLYAFPSYIVYYCAMQEPDCAEELLKSEHTHLLNLKRSLEAHLHKVKFQLQELNSIRCSLFAVIQERSRVTDLLCQSMGGSNGSGGCSGRLVGLGSSSFVKFPSCSLFPSGQRGSDSMMMEGHSRGANATHSKAYSAPVPLEIADMPGLLERSASEIELVPGK